MICIQPPSLQCMMSQSTSELITKWADAPRPELKQNKNDIVTWKHVCITGLFDEGNLSMTSGLRTPHKGSIMCSFEVCLIVGLVKLVNKQLSCQHMIVYICTIRPKVVAGARRRLGLKITVPKPFRSIENERRFFTRDK